MTEQGFSISALARKLGRNWRTVAWACSARDPVARKGRTPLYSLEDVRQELENTRGLTGHARQVARGQRHHALTPEQVANRERVWAELVELGVVEDF